MNASLVVIHAKPKLVSIPVCRFAMYIDCSTLSIDAKGVIISRIRRVKSQLKVKPCKFKPSARRSVC